jgi:hypothetical protein
MWPVSMVVGGAGRGAGRRRARRPGPSPRCGPAASPSAPPASHAVLAPRSPVTVHVVDAERPGVAAQAAFGPQHRPAVFDQDQPGSADRAEVRMLIVRQFLRTGQLKAIEPSRSRSLRWQRQLPIASGCHREIPDRLLNSSNHTPAAEAIRAGRVPAAAAVLAVRPERRRSEMIGTGPDAVACRERGRLRRISTAAKRRSRPPDAGTVAGTREDGAGFAVEATECPVRSGSRWFRRGPARPGGRCWCCAAR